MLLSIEWNTFFSITDNIDVLSDNLTDMLHHFTELCIPSKIVTVRPGDKPGITSEVRKLFRQAKRLHKRAKRTGLPEQYAHFSDKRREAKAAFRKASNTFYTNISDILINPNTSQKSYWKLTKMVSNGIHNIMCGDRLIDDSTEMAKWNKHIEKCICKASKRIALLNRVRLKLPRGTLCLLYKSMVLPIIEYCDIIYDNCTGTEEGCSGVHWSISSH